MFAATCSSGTGLDASLQLCQAKITSKKISRKVRGMLALLSVGLVSSLQFKGGIAGIFGGACRFSRSLQGGHSDRAETAEATRREPGLYGHNGHLAVLVLPLLQHFRLFSCSSHPFSTCRFLYHKSFSTVSPYVQSMSQAVPD